MKYPTIFDFIATEFKKAGIDFVLIGGFAVNAYDFTRQTKDIDFMIADQDYEKAKKVFENAEFQEFEHEKTFSRWRTNCAPPILDLIFTDRSSLTKLIEHGTEKTIAGRHIKVPSLEHLIAMKLHAMKQQPERREWKDWIDVIQLIKVNHVDVKADHFRELCLKFGTEELYRRIVDHEAKVKDKY